ncbi:HPr kinase/phosphorylase [Clostridia bacterium]|nr:HPr kinase/phosphorylase [Clostridia bacterium]
MEKIFEVPLTDIIEEFKLSVIYAPDDMDERVVVSDNVNRPGLQLAGFYDYFDASRVQIFGKGELSYLSTFEKSYRRAAIERLMRKRIPCIILSRAGMVFPELMELAQKHEIPLLQTKDPTSTLQSSMISSLKVKLAPRITRHGVFVEVYGEGLLLMGDSGVGKSECAIELVKRGHRLVADDAVELKKVSATSLVGSAPELLRHYIELRGIGVIDVRRIFGMAAVKPTEKLDLVINLELWTEGSAYDRLGLDDHFTTMLDVQVPLLTIPVKPGRNLAVIIEVAAMNNRHKKLGYNSAQEFASRINSHFGK